MKKLQAFFIIIFLLLIILIPCLLLSFFSINAIKNEESLYQSRLELRYKNLLSKIRDQSREILFSQEKKILSKITPQFIERDWVSLFEGYKSLLQGDKLFEFPFLISPAGKKIFPKNKNLILPSADREETLWQIFEPARTLEESGKIENALIKFRDLASLYRNQGDVHIEVLLALGRCYSKLENYSRSLSIYQDLLRLYPLESQGNISLPSLQSWINIGKIYQKTGNLDKYHEIYLKMLKFLLETKQAFPLAYFSKIKDELIGGLTPSPNPEVRKRLTSFLQLEEELDLEFQISKLFERRMLGYLTDRIKRKDPADLTPSEIRFSIPLYPQMYGRLGHLKASSPQRQGILFYYVLPHPEGSFILGAFIRGPYFLNTYVQSKIDTLGEDKEVQITVKETREAKDSLLVEQPLFYPFEQILLQASLRDRHLFRHLSSVRVKNYFFAIVMAIITIGVGAVGILVFVFRQMQTAQLKSDFVSNVTHELKTPLTSIRMFVETILMGRVKDRKEELECLTIISKETERLSRLIEKVLDFSPIENKIKGFHFKNSSFEKVLQESIDLFKQQMGESPCIFRLNTIQNLHTIRIDREAIKEVLLNLFSNAVKYCEKPPQITISLKESKKYIIIEVLDNGIGIPPKHIKKIFQKFYRINNYLTSSKEGTGLGLAICKSIIRAHRGKILAESKGEGSKFIVFLPKK